MVTKLRAEVRAKKIDGKNKVNVGKITRVKRKRKKSARRTYLDLPTYNLYIIRKKLIQLFCSAML